MELEPKIERKDRISVSVSAAVFIEDESGRLLLVQQESKEKGNKWGPPAGGMKPHEDPMQTAIREAEEEMEVKVELTGLIGIYTVDRGERSGIAFAFRGKIISGNITPAEGEIRDYGYFDKEGIEDIISQGMLYKPEYNLLTIEDWQKGYNYDIEAVRGIATLS